MIIFKKYRQKPLDLQVLDMVIPRLKDARLVSQLKQDATRIQKGFNGERKLDYHLTQLRGEYDILCDITLQWAARPFQIDTLVISPQAIFIISVKSLEGIITFHPHNRTLIQEINGTTNRYECPIIQAERHKAMLMKWLEKRNLGSLPIYYIIGISEMSTTIQINDEQMKQHVHYIESIPNVLLEVAARHGNTRNIRLQKRITSQILQRAEDFYIDYVKKYNIRKRDIALGVVCKHCKKLNVTFRRGKFICHTCGRLPIEDALQSLYDLMKLFNVNCISNKQAMDILQLSDRHQTLRILRASKLVKRENTYKWHLPKK